MRIMSPRHSIGGVRCRWPKLFGMSLETGADDGSMDFVEKYLSWAVLENGLSERTVRAYRSDLAAYISWVDEMGAVPDSATSEVLESYFGKLRRDGESPSKINRSLAAVRQLYRWQVVEGQRSDDPTVSLRRSTKRTPLPPTLSINQVNRLLDNICGEDPTPMDMRDKALLETMYGLGGRTTEILNMDIGDVNLTEREAVLFGKFDRERVLPLTRHAASAIEMYLPFRAELINHLEVDTQALWIVMGGGKHHATRLGSRGVLYLFRKALEGARLDTTLTPHVLRHSLATHLLENGSDIMSVKELLGHSSVNSTMLYTKVAARSVQQAYEAAHPRAKVAADPS